MLIAILFIGIPTYGVAVEGNNLSAQEVYNVIRKANSERFPEYFSARLSSAVINLQLKNIPQDMIEFGKKPELRFYFKKNYSPRLILSHVELFYRNFFSPYEDVFSRSGLFLGIDSRGNYKNFVREFEIMELKSTAQGVNVHVREREGLPGDYAIYFFNKKWDVLRVLFYEAEEETTEIKFYYANQKGYHLPKRILIYLKGENALTQGNKTNEDEDHFVINFIDYSFKAPKGLDIGL